MSRLQEDCYNPALLLSEQYRMAPAIASWPHRAYYGNRVRTAGSVLRRAQPWSGPVREYCMIDTGVVEVDGTVGRSAEAADQGSVSKYDTSCPCLPLLLPFLLPPLRAQLHPQFCHIHL